MAGAGLETILAAGAVGSPQILQLSGLGPADLLRQHGVDVAVDLPGVGSNLQVGVGGFKGEACLLLLLESGVGMKETGAWGRLEDRLWWSDSG